MTAEVIRLIQKRIEQLEAAKPMTAVSMADVMGEIRGLRWTIDILRGGR